MSHENCYRFRLRKILQTQVRAAKSGGCPSINRHITRVMGGGSRHLGWYISKFLAIGRCIFSQKSVFFRNFRDISNNITQKITSYCMFINKIPNNFQKIVQKFFASNKIKMNFALVPIHFKQSPKSKHNQHHHVPFNLRCTILLHPRWKS